MQNPNAMSAIVSAAVGTATVILIAVAMMVVASRQTMANPEMAKKTGQPCAKCHTTPPVLNGYGKKYKSSLDK
jgi:hypothetical protein